MVVSAFKWTDFLCVYFLALMNCTMPEEMWVLFVNTLIMDSA
jgi:hypothetical protein